MSNRYAVELAQLRPAHGPCGGWEREYGESGHAWVSDDGVDVLVALARLWERHAVTLEAWMDVYGMTACVHGRALKWDLEWTINDYCFDVLHGPERAVFMLFGIHGNGQVCAPWGYHAAGCFFVWNDEDARWPE